MTVKLIKNGGMKLLSKESGLIDRLIAEGWELQTEEKKEKPISYEKPTKVIKKKGNGKG